MLYVLVAVGLGCILVERIWPAMALPKVRAWWPRVISVNLLQLGMVILAGYSWDIWLGRISVFSISQDISAPFAGGITYLIASFVYYWWHRLRHESKIFWLLCHQLHHSPRRLEVITAFYKHPLELFINSLISSSIAYLLLGCSIEATAWYSLFAGIAEFFYHWNFTTPHWLGYIIQRPEAHKVHHKKAYHTDNYGDLPILDIAFGTFNNPQRFNGECGFDDWREDRLEDMLVCRDVNATNTENIAPLQFLPTCIGCSKRWACYEVRASTPDE